MIACRLTLRLAVGSIIFCAPLSHMHACMCCRATGQQPRLAERAGQKIILPSTGRGVQAIPERGRQPSDLCMQGLHVDHWLGRDLRSFAEHPRCALKQLVPPLFDLVRLSVFAAQTPAGNR